MPFVHFHRDAAQAGDRVHQIQAACGVDQIAHLLHRIADTGRGLGMHNGHDLVMILGQQLLHPLYPDRGTPLKLFLGDLSAQAGSYIRHPVAENAVLQYQDLIPRLHQVYKGSLHARRTGAGKRYRHLILGLHELAQPLLDLLHNLEKIGVQMTQHGLGKGPVGAGRHAAGAGPQQKGALNAVQVILFHHGLHALL